MPVGWLSGWGMGFGMAGLAAAEATAEVNSSHQAFFASHCMKCHSEKAQEGGVRLDDLPFAIATVETAERWQKVLGVLNAGEMPPADEPQPTPDAKLEFLADLSQALAAARKAIGDAGQVTLVRRLNRREYRHTLRDLLGVEVDTSSLPADTGTGSFDTIGSGLFMSSDQLEQYLAIGRTAIAAAASDWPKPGDTKPERKTERREAEVAARKQIEGLLNGYFLGGYRKAKEWEAAGADPDKTKDFGFPDKHEAKFRIQAYENHGPYLEHFLAAPHSDKGAWLMYASNNYHDTEAITIPPVAPPGDYLLRLRVAAATDAPQVRRFLEMGTKGSKDDPRGDFETIETFQVTGTIDQPQVLEIPVRVTASGPRTWYFREKRYNDGHADHFQNSLEKAKNGVGRELALWIDWVEWDGPVPSGSPSVIHEQVFGDLPKKGPEGQIVRTILRRFGKLAFRGATPANDFLDRLVTVYETRRKAGDEPLVAIREPMAVMLASPGFLYLADPLAAQSDTDRDDGKTDDRDDGDHNTRRLSDRELATRLAYFLWAAPPDAKLLALAASGELRKPTVLAAEVDRMIADEKSHDFAAGFIHQWLGLDRLDFFRFDHQLYPDFDESTREAAKREVYETFHTLLADNGDARELLKSDVVVVNGLLATYYGLDDAGTTVTGDAFRIVKLGPKSPRGGLLGMAAILAMGSNGERTSPVERGAWVLRKLLNNPPPPAPPNIPQLARLESKPVTTRERLRMHQEQPQCAQCHRSIDPIGMGLENFDAAGRWRTEEHFYGRGWVVKDKVAGKVVQQSWPIEPAGAFHNGPSFQNFYELRDEIATAHGDAFVHGLIENLFAYAIGRPVSFADAEAIEAMSQAAARDGGVKSIVQRLVASEEFQRK
jgi:mono/diheme cytochrome c family protein